MLAVALAGALVIGFLVLVEGPTPGAGAPVDSAVEEPAPGKDDPAEERGSAALSGPAPGPAPLPAGAAAALQAAEPDREPTRSSASLVGLPPLPSTAQSVSGKIAGAIAGAPVQVWIEKNGPLVQVEAGADGRFLLELPRPVEDGTLVARSGDLIARLGPITVELGDRRRIGRLVLHGPQTSLLGLSEGLAQLEKAVHARLPTTLQLQLVAEPGVQLPGELHVGSLNGQRVSVSASGTFSLRLEQDELRGIFTLHAPELAPLLPLEDPAVERYLEQYFWGEEPPAPETFELRASAAARLAGRLATPGDEALADVVLKLSFSASGRPLGHPDLRVRSDPDGDFEVGGLPAADCSVTVEGYPGARFDPRRIALQPGRTAQLSVLRLPPAPTGRLAIRLTDMHGRPLPNLAVRARPRFTPWSGATAVPVTWVAGADGAVLTPALLPGAWQLELDAPRGFDGLGESARLEVIVRDGETVSAALALAP